MVDIWLIFGRYLVNFVMVDIYYNPTGRPVLGTCWGELWEILGKSLGNFEKISGKSRGTLGKCWGNLWEILWKSCGKFRANLGGFMGTSKGKFCGNLAEIFLKSWGHHGDFLEK